MPAAVKAIILTILAAAAVYLAGNARVQLWDRDEPRYAQCSRQMLQSGDWVVPRLYDKLRFQKPPLIYWCQASAMKVFGSEGGAGAFSARLPSAIAMLGTLIVLAIVISKYVGVDQAAWTVFVMASSVMTIIAAKTCLTDSVLLLFTVVAQFCLYALWRGNRSWSVMILMAIMLGLGGLTKGPFIVGIVGCTAAALGLFRVVGLLISSRAGTARRELDRPQAPVGGQCPPYVGIIVGMVIVAVIVGPWLYMVHRRAPEFLDKTLAEAEAHAIHGKEGHNFPPGYHLLVVWPMFMPWSLLLPLTIGLGIRNRKVHQVRFALAAVLGPWLMVEFMGTKLPQYFLPAYPALAYLVAYAIRDCLRLTNGPPEAVTSAEIYPRRVMRSAGPDPRVTPGDPGRRCACPGVDKDTDCAATSSQPHIPPHDLGSKPFLIGAAIWALAIVCIGALPWLAAGSVHIGKFRIGSYFSQLPWIPMIGLTVLGILFGVGVFFLFYRQKFAPAFISMGIGMLATFGLACTCYFPNAGFLRISTHVAGVLQRVGATHPGDAKMVGYLEPSLAFYQGGTIREVEKRLDLVNKPIERWPHWVVMSRDVWNMLPAASRCRLRIVDSCRGLAYSDGGRVVEVLVVENPVY